MFYGEPQENEDGNIALPEEKFGEYDSYKRYEAQFSPDNKYIAYARVEAQQGEYDPYYKDSGYELVVYPIDDVSQDGGKDKEDNYVVIDLDERMDRIDLFWFDERRIIYRLIPEEERDDNKNQYRIVDIETGEKADLFNGEFVNI